MRINTEATEQKEKRQRGHAECAEETQSREEKAEKIRKTDSPLRLNALCMHSGTGIPFLLLTEN
jgi:hypothetical protein